MEIRYFKLANGEDLISRVEEVNGSDISVYVLHNPMRILQVPYDRSLVISVTEWFPGSSKTKDIEIDKSHVIGRPFKTDNENLLKSYQELIDADGENAKQFSSIRQKLLNG